MLWFIKTTITLLALGVLFVGLFKQDLNTILMGLLFVGASIFVNGRYSRRGIEARQLRELEKLNRRVYGQKRD